MKLSALIFTTGIFATTVSSFTPISRNAVQRTAFTSIHTPTTTSSPKTPSSASSSLSYAIDVYDELAQRDVYSMQEWAQSYGTQIAEGVELYTADGADYQLITQAPIPAGSSVLYVPADIVLSSNNVVQEYGQALSQAENILVQMEQGLQERLPLFRLMVKIMAEYEKGEESPYFPWLNSMPRQFYNGVAMTGKFYLLLIC